MTDYGIDVSGYNDVTDWSAVRGVGNSWTWSKATQGNYYTNPLFAAQMSGARAAGLLVGAYHFPDPNVSVAANVSNFVTIAKPQGTFAQGAFVPMLDVENSAIDGIVWTAANADPFILAFRDQLRAATGVQELCVYGAASWFKSGLLNAAHWLDDNVTICVAEYSGVPGQVSWAHPRAAIQQYTDNAPTPGVTRVTDRDCTLGGWTAAELTIGASMALTDDDIGLFMRYNVLRPGGDPNVPADYVNVGDAFVAATDTEGLVQATKTELDALKAEVDLLKAGVVVDVVALAKALAPLLQASATTTVNLTPVTPSGA